MIASRPSALFVAAIGTFVVLTPVRAHAQWWRSAPSDFESCADAAEKSKTKEEKTAALADCNAKFAGRRKPGGGYTRRICRLQCARQQIVESTEL